MEPTNITWEVIQGLKGLTDEEYKAGEASYHSTHDSEYLTDEQREVVRSWTVDVCNGGCAPYAVADAVYCTARDYLFARYVIEYRQAQP